MDNRLAQRQAMPALVICPGPGNVQQKHAVPSVRSIEYRGDSSYPWEKRLLCEDCIADARHAGMQIKGEQPDVSHEAEKLISWVIDSSFACGEWTSDEDRPYEEVNGEADEAKAKLRAYVADLEARVLSDATGVR